MSDVLTIDEIIIAIIGDKSIIINNIENFCQIFENILLMKDIKLKLTKFNTIINNLFFISKETA
tara:strand:+ start:1534 stop:1725 length:192 start_codon:yes stop_codon:yes gene_type:complete